MSHTLGYVLVSALALVGAGFIVRIYLKWKNKLRRQKTADFVDTAATDAPTRPAEPVVPSAETVEPTEPAAPATPTESTTPTAPANQAPPTKPTDPIIKPTDPIIELLRPKVESFSGNFSALRDIANDANLDVRYADSVFENVSNVVAMQYGDDVKKWYSSFVEDRKSWGAALYSAKAAKLMELLTACGVTPSDETEVVWGEVASRRYNRMANLGDGESCRVLSPCWTLAGKLIEKGMVERKG